VQMTMAVCVRCGLAKNRPVDRCARCGLQPQNDEEKAKSLILSTAYELNGEYRGKTIEELKAVAAAIEAGQPYPFDPAEVRAVIEYAHQVMAIPARRLIVDGLKWILPPLAILGVVYFLLLLFMNR
jgi:hypothetical protein